jgi:FkbM family methyltransferase
MLITVDEIMNSWNLNPSGVLHIGAHQAEESSSYKNHNWTPVIWVEANPSLIDQIKSIIPVEDTIVCAALWDIDDAEAKFNIANNGESSSLLKPLEHLEAHPQVQFAESIQVRTRRLDSLFTNIPNFLNLDVQGAELRVLKGMGKLIDSVDFIYTEVNERELYADCAKISEIDEFLRIHGFKRICMRKAGSFGWGDAFYARCEIGLKMSLRISCKTFRLYLTHKLMKPAAHVKPLVSLRGLFKS